MLVLFIFKILKTRSKILKQQEQLQYEIVKEINSKIADCNEKKSSFVENYEKFNLKQKELKERLTQK